MANKCGCRIVEYVGYRPWIREIEYCPMHKNAQNMKDTLTSIAKLYPEPGGSITLEIVINNAKETLLIEKMEA